jgi:hypothetical protein
MWKTVTVSNIVWDSEDVSEEEMEAASVPSSMTVDVEVDDDADEDAIVDEALGRCLDITGYYVRKFHAELLADEPDDTGDSLVGRLI